ncbi:unnamed protein product [Somion occarium]|uniref:F-box domain-containing protein n=1 Tax=Somion occarium TaxID=3059160 RepID=A0ABP1DP68_9APHY
MSHAKRSRRSRKAGNVIERVQAYHADTAFPLPVELVDIVFGYLWRTPKALRACALTCRSWHSTARPHIFRNIILRGQPSINALVEAISADCTVAYWIREVRLYGYDSRMTGAPPHDPAPPFWQHCFPAVFTPRLPKLTSIEFHSWKHVLTELPEKECFINWLSELEELTGVRKLTLTNCQFDERSLTALACAFPNLVDVHFHGTSVLGPDSFHFPLQQIIQQIFQLVPNFFGNQNAPNNGPLPPNPAPVPPHPVHHANVNVNPHPHPHLHPHPFNPPQQFFHHPLPGIQGAIPIVHNVPMGPILLNPHPLPPPQDGVVFPSLHPNPKLRTLQIHRPEKAWSMFKFSDLSNWVKPEEIAQSLKRLDAIGDLNSLAHFLTGLGAEPALERLELCVRYHVQDAIHAGLDLSQLSNLTTLHIRIRALDDNRVPTILHILGQLNAPRLRRIALHTSFRYYRQFRPETYVELDACLATPKFKHLEEFLLIYVGALTPSKVVQRARAVFPLAAERNILKVTKYPDSWCQEGED